MPAIFPSFTSAAMRSSMRSRACWKGISVTTIRLRLSCSSIWARARTTIVLRPVWYPRRMPERPQTTPPVGKSGPGTISNNSSIETSGSSITRIIASQISPRLCGGIEVAMPTAMPLAPFTSRLGNFEGKTVGSVRRSS